MSDRSVYLVAYVDPPGRWEIRLISGRDEVNDLGPGSAGVLKAHEPTREKAIDRGREIARADQPSQMLVKNRTNGRWSFENTYGADPERTPG